MSKINLTYNKKDYILEYNRQSVKTMESQGFVLEELTAKPMTMIPMLFAGAFIKNCKGMKRNDIDKIYKGIKDKTGLMEALIEMYTDTISTLTDEEEEGNVTWTLVK